ncbi:MAG: hypothetical protein HUU20_22205 [Pirellulales bacterium]|nr:hypothetical protein [Pirellulales bacterium]
MSYSFPPNLQQLVQDALASGKYRDTEQMLVEAVQLLRDRDEQTERLPEDLAERIERLDGGEATELQAFEHSSRDHS